MKKYLLALSLCLLVGCSAPANTEPTPLPSSTTTLETTAETTTTPNTSENGDWDQYEGQGFKKETETLGLGLFTDDTGALRDCYIPYGGTITSEPNALTGMNHGVAITVSFDSSATVASEAVEHLVTRIQTENLDSLEMSEIQSADNDTVAVEGLRYNKTIEGQSVLVYSFAYGDIREKGYFQAWLEFMPELYDDQTEALVYDIEDYYGLSLADLILVD